MRIALAIAALVVVPAATPGVDKLILTPAWQDIAEAVGGGPAIVRNGKPVFRSFELFTPAQLSTRTARTAVGQTADGRILLVAVDGRQPGYSTGLTNFELALLMMRLGAVTASALDTGGSTTMAFDGKLLNRPSDPAGERAVYYGVYAPAPDDAVVFPNGDGAADTETLSYKLARRSTVSASLVGPGGASIPLDSGMHDPGPYKFTWAGKTPDGPPAAEGKWTFSVTATDDQGLRSVAERQLSLNTTLGFLTARGAGLRLTATYKLARAARVVTRIEAPSGAVVRTLLARSVDAGTATTSWRGRPGRYVLSVTATNDTGSVEQTAPFILRRG